MPPPAPSGVLRCSYASSVPTDRTMPTSSLMFLLHDMQPILSRQGTPCHGRSLVSRANSTCVRRAVQSVHSFTTYVTMAHTCTCLHELASLTPLQALPRMIPVSDMHTLLLHLHPSSQSLARELHIIDSNVLARHESCCGLRCAVDGAAEAASVRRDICFGLQRERRCAEVVVAQRCSRAVGPERRRTRKVYALASAVFCRNRHVSDSRAAFTISNTNIKRHGAMASQTASGRQSDD